MAGRDQTLFKPDFKALFDVKRGIWSNCLIQWKKVVKKLPEKEREKVAIFPAYGYNICATLKRKVRLPLPGRKHKMARSAGNTHLKSAAAKAR